MVKKTNKKVVIYTTHSCPWCHMAKEFLDENKIKYTNKFVDTDKKAAQEMIKKSKQRAVPVIDIEGEIIVGYNEDKIKSALGI